MSSGEKAKPPATFEERNPFDISRRSGPEVAAEIAKRMSAWKQARARATPAPTTHQSRARPSGDAKSPSIAAPVQPARVPKAAAHGSPPTPALVDAGSAAPRIPWFAVSATRRAMPPAPSLKPARPPASGGDELAARAAKPEIAQAAPVPWQVARGKDEPPPQVVGAAAATTTSEAPVAEAGPGGSAAIMEAPLQADIAPAQAEPTRSRPFESPPASQTSEPASAAPNENEPRRAEARALRARWIAARDLDGPLERPAAAAPADEAAYGSGAGEGPDPLAREPEGGGADIVRSSTEELLPDVSSKPAAVAAATQVDEPAFPAALMAAPVREPEATAGQTAPVVERDAGQRAPARKIPALDEMLDRMAGRREPTFDKPAARAAPETLVDAASEPSVRAPDDAAVPLGVKPAAADAPDLATATPGTADDRRALGIAALDVADGRGEPTFDAAIQCAAPDGAVADGTTAARDDATGARAAAELPPIRFGAVGAVNEWPAAGIGALEEGRKQPTLDVPRVRLRAIETRIEARRVDTLRADPQLAPRRPMFPHIAPEERDVPPMVAARAGRERRGTSWAIGLGSLLLVAGITAPAAIWQQGRQVPDQVALVAPAPAAPSPDAAATAGAITDQASAQATPPTAVAAQQSSATAAVEPKLEAGEAAAVAPPATKLGAIGDGADIATAPIVAPPSPMVNLASKAPPASVDTPMAARPFVPEQGNGPFLRAPTTGGATVPVTGGDAKPRLIGLLKPKTVASVSKPVASKPVQRKPKPFFQQSPDQMFETLIETLTEGKPVNPATNPASPSNRR